MAKERAILQAALLKRAALTRASGEVKPGNGIDMIDMAQIAVEVAALTGWAIAIIAHCL